jgi:hypothetical protein
VWGLNLIFPICKPFCLGFSIVFSNPKTYEPRHFLYFVFVRNNAKPIQVCIIMKSFFCVFVTSIKMVEMEFLIICCEPSIRFFLNHFKKNLELVDHCKYYFFCLTWWKEFTSYIDYATLFLEGQLYILHATNSTNSVMNMVNK